MTNSHVQEEEAGIFFFFLARQCRRSYHEELLPVSLFRTLSFIRGGVHRTSSHVSAGRTMVSDSQCFFSTHPEGLQSILTAIHPSAIHLPYHRTYYTTTLAPHSPSHQASLLTPAGVKSNPLLLGQR